MIREESASALVPTQNVSQVVSDCNCHQNLLGQYPVKLK